MCEKESGDLNPITQDRRIKPEMRNCNRCGKSRNSRREYLAHVFSDHHKKKIDGIERNSNREREYIRMFDWEEMQYTVQENESEPIGSIV